MAEEKKEVLEAEQAPAEQAAPTMEAVMHDPDAPVITMRKLLEAGAHFGHQTRRWNPKMKKYIYGARNGVYIIDLQQTVDAITVAYAKMKEIVDNGGKVLFVGTKKQCQEAVQQEALRSGSFYITNRWLGGTLTNFKTIQSRIRYLKDLERREEEGELDLLSKVEAAQLRREKEKLSKNLDGIKEMRKIPNAIFVIDPRIEHNAVAEARKLNIPVFAVPVVAYTKDEGEAVTMKEVIRQTEKENAEKLAKIRAERQARQEAYEKEQAEREARRAAEKQQRRAAKPKAPKAEGEEAAPAAEEAPKAEGENK